jgi:hypothetical protein
MVADIDAPVRGAMLMIVPVFVIMVVVVAVMAVVMAMPVVIMAVFVIMAMPVVMPVFVIMVATMVVVVVVIGPVFPAGITHTKHPPLIGTQKQHPQKPGGFWERAALQNNASLRLFQNPMVFPQPPL